MSPFARSVAGAAFATVTARMLVIVLVTGIAAGTKLDAIELAGMADVAMYPGMCAA